MNSRVQFVDVFGVPVTPWFPAQTRGTFKISDLFVVDDFISQTIKVAQSSIAKQLPPIARVWPNEKDKERLLFERTLVDNLYRNLKATFYHGQNFIYRFRAIADEFSQKPVDLGTGIIKVVDQDFPLEFEIESYMVRYRTCVELMVKLIALKATSVDPRTKFNFGGTIDTICKKPKNSVQQTLATVIIRNMNWIEEQRKIRNTITHDGANGVLNNFEHVRGTTLNATVLNRTADVMTLQMFRQLTEFTKDVVQTIYVEGDDTVG